MGFSEAGSVSGVRISIVGLLPKKISKGDRYCEVSPFLYRRGNSLLIEVVIGRWSVHPVCRVSSSFLRIFRILLIALSASELLVEV